MRKARFILVGALMLLTAGACKPLDDTMVAIFGRSMRDQRKFDPYENTVAPPTGGVAFSSGNEAGALDEFNVGRPEMLAEPLFTQADMQPIGTGGPIVQSLENPFERGDSAALARGEEIYMRVCWTCHAENGVGAQAPIAANHPTVAAYNLAGPQVTGYTDQYIYGMITVGRGLMPPWAHQIRPIDRWAVVTYVRQLQTEAQGDQ